MLESISQSKEFSSEYNKKKEALLKAKEDTQFHFNKKKSATVEKKEVSKERIEVMYQHCQVERRPAGQIQPTRACKHSNKTSKLLEHF